MLLNYNPKHCLPSAEDLPDSDDTPVDNQLNNGNYELLTGEPIWLSELNLGIGKEIGIYQGIEREWLYWYDENGKRYLTPEERIKSEGKQRQKKGEIEGKQTLIFRQLNLKLGKISLASEQKIKEVSSSQLDDLSLALFEFTDLNRLNQWLVER